MYKRTLDSILRSALIFQIAYFVVPSQSSSEKVPKDFSLFSVVTFQNKECTTDSSLTGGSTQGTCYSSTECSDKSGTASGNCASGFGVCCAFLNTAAVTSTITENRTRLRNTEFPSTQSATDAKNIVYTVNKMSSDICQIRLDFTRFVIGGPFNILENIPATNSGTHCTRDKLTITTSDITAVTSTRTSTLCGALTNEHLYVELSPTASDAATITLDTVATATLTPTIAQREWDIKISQIECFATYRAPLGCDKYLMEDQGQITSYNFYKTTGTTQAANAQNTGVELGLQRVNTCIRRSKGMCCIEYQVCATFNGEQMIDMNNGGNDDGSGAIFNWAFSIDLNVSPFVLETTKTNIGMTDDQCTTDYIEIPSSWSGACGGHSTGNRATVNTRYCGARLGANPGLSTVKFAGTPVCDCSEPFVVRHQSDDLNDLGGLDNDGASGVAFNNPNQAATTFPRGFCLDYRQASCWA